MEIQKMLCLSTAHLPVSERKALDQRVRTNDNRPLDSGPIVDAIGSMNAEHGSYGWRVHVTEDSHEYLQFPVLTNLLHLAASLECDWLAIDCDGPIEGFIPTYEDTP